MVDRASLEIMGFILGGVTAVVIVIAALVVHQHVGGRIALDPTAPVLPVSLAAPR